MWSSGRLRRRFADTIGRSGRSLLRLLRLLAIENSCVLLPHTVQSKFIVDIGYGRPLEGVALVKVSLTRYFECPDCRLEVCIQYVGIGIALVEFQLEIVVARQVRHAFVRV